MLRNKPRLSYCGLTVVLSNPSRFDKLNLLTSTGGVLFNNHCLQPEFNQMQCDIRLMDDSSPWLPNTKCILLLGEPAMHKYTAKDTGGNTLNEMRGSPLYIDNIPAIASYDPQNSADIRTYEAQFNPLSKDYSPEDGADNEDEETGDIKAFSNTKRANYAFWLRMDTKKCKQILTTGATKWTIEREPEYRIYPSADETINALRGHKDEYFYFDMETDFEEQNMLCFSFSFDGKIVYSIPILDYNYRHAYTALPFIIRSLIDAISSNIIVAHNGAAFDFFVLAFKYNIPIRRAYDTMIAQHRCFPDIEKSLGHGTSLWTNQRFHKDTDSQSYFTQEHMMKKLRYCGKDVFTMYLIHQAITKYAKTIPGLSDSISTAMSAIRPYLTCMLQGVKYSEEKRKKIVQENDRLMEQYIRVINMLIGEDGIRECKKAIKSGHAKAFPGSNKQCVNYFYHQLDYTPVVPKSKKTGQDSLGAKAMYLLALAHDNPVIMFTMLYRAVQKETGALEFNPWKDDNGKIFSRRKPELIDI